ncbi:hypothetical protein [Leucobacter japonicus]|uniref:hypothetical protein n=1 Tax=Leucobacter japonicus TaxID=1461259 RepID=UPI0006A7E8DA|nr:hypothetical protein [Leucobacter japonicus]
MAKVVIANRYVGSDGRAYKGGEVAEVTSGEARVLIGQGKARPHVEQDKPVLPAVKEAKNG